MMDIRSYIASGILESYIFGELSAAESSEVERMISEYPELRAELQRIEEELEIIGHAGAVAPPEFIKENILRKTISVSGSSVSSAPVKTNYWQWVSAACLIIAVTASVIAFNYRSKYIRSIEELTAVRESNERMASEYNRVNQRIDQLSDELNITSDAQFQRIVLNGTENNNDNRVNVFWNPETKETYLKIARLKEIAANQQYQLWAIIDGKPVNAGVFSGDGFIKVEPVTDANAFAITVEPQGGSDEPTLSTMLVLGNVSS